MRVNALVRSDLLPLQVRGTTYNGLFHVTDWLPTIFGVLNLTDRLTVELDGVNQWDALMGSDGKAPRQNMVYNIDYGAGANANETFGAIRVGDMKILRNVQVLAPFNSSLSLSLDDHTHTHAYTRLAFSGCRCGTSRRTRRRLQWTRPIILI
jgi:arylsulfatase A-like enzyme